MVILLRDVFSEGPMTNGFPMIHGYLFDLTDGGA
jgi:hypothetical protein